MKRGHGKIISALPLLGVLMLVAGGAMGQTNEPLARIAIISEAGEFSAVADLLTVELSPNRICMFWSASKSRKIYRSKRCPRQTGIT